MRCKLRELGAPCLPSLFHLSVILIVKIMAPGFVVQHASWNVILTAIDHVILYLTRLHPSRSGAAQVVRRPFSIPTIRKDKGIVLLPPNLAVRVLETGL